MPTLIYLLFIIVIHQTLSNYNCDPSICKLPSCLCPSPSPPGGLSVAETPQLILLTYDDALNSQTFPSGLSVMRHKNPNGCPIKSTWFVSHAYTDYHAVQQYYARGNEVADHTVDHLYVTTAAQILVLKDIINNYSKVPKSDIVGFRSPFLNTNPESLTTLQNNQFLYDITLEISGNSGYVSQGVGNMIWPYTLDNGIASVCYVGECDTNGKYNGVWSIPMYDFFKEDLTVLSSMDPTNGESLYDILVRNFNIHYNGNRTPFGIWLHPAYLMGDPNRVSDLNKFIDWVSSTHPIGSSWFVTGKETIDFMKNPQPIGTYKSSTCPARLKLDKETICDGLDDDGDGLVDNGLVRNCGYLNGAINVCGSCPTTIPDFSNPLPPDQTASAIPSTSLGVQPCMPPSGGCVNGYFNIDMCKCECELAHFNPSINLYTGGFCLDPSGKCTVERIAISKNISIDVVNFVNSLSSDDEASPNFMPVYYSAIAPVLDKDIAFLCPTQTTSFAAYKLNNVYLQAKQSNIVLTSSPVVATTAPPTLAPTLAAATSATPSTLIPATNSPAIRPTLIATIFPSGTGGNGGNIIPGTGGSKNNETLDLSFKSAGFSTKFEMFIALLIIIIYTIVVFMNY